MKKILVLVFICFLLVGCGKGTVESNTTSNETKKEAKTPNILTCSIYTENSVNFTTEMSFKFKNDLPTELGVRYIYDLKPLNDDQKQVFATSKMCEMESITSKLGMRDCHESLEGDEYIVYGYADKLLTQTQGSLKQLQAVYVQQGWTCNVQ